MNKPTRMRSRPTKLRFNNGVRHHMHILWVYYVHHGLLRTGSERLNAQLLVDPIPALIHTARPDGYLDYFNKPWPEYEFGEA